MSSLAKQFVWGISKKKDGTMKYDKSRTDNSVTGNREKFFKKSGININDTVTAGLVHDHKVKIVGKRDLKKIISGTDGLIAKDKKIFLTITTADCLPLYFFDKEKKVIGLAHAGWRGILENVAGSMIKAMVKKCTANPKDIIVRIGPHIRPCHFAVKTDVARRFGQEREFIVADGDRYFINLAGIVKKQLMASGVKAKNIVISTDCTYCRWKKYFSYRREGKKGRFMLAYIGMRSD